MNNCVQSWLGNNKSLSWEYEMTTSKSLSPPLLPPLTPPTEAKTGATLTCCLSPTLIKKYTLPPEFGSKKLAREAVARWRSGVKGAWERPRSFTRQLMRPFAYVIHSRSESGNPSLQGKVSVSSRSPANTPPQGQYCRRAAQGDSVRVMQACWKSIAPKTSVENDGCRLASLDVTPALWTRRSLHLTLLNNATHTCIA